MNVWKNDKMNFCERNKEIVFAKILFQKNKLTWAASNTSKVIPDGMWRVWNQELSILINKDFGSPPPLYSYIKGTVSVILSDPACKINHS